MGDARNVLRIRGGNDDVNTGEVERCQRSLSGKNHVNIDALLVSGRMVRKASLRPQL